jgi:Ca-activated chloride channel family protein
MHPRTAPCASLQGNPASRLRAEPGLDPRAASGRAPTAGWLPLRSARASRVVVTLGLVLALSGCDGPAPPAGPLATTDAPSPGATTEAPAASEETVTISLASKEPAPPPGVHSSVTDALQGDEPEIFFPPAEPADHNEACGESADAFSSYLPGPDGGAKGRGVTDAMGVGGGGARSGGRHGGRRNLVARGGSAATAEPRVKEGSPLSGQDGFVTTEGEGKASTFAVDVDTASYATVRQALTHGLLPDPAAVRIEELVNYFEFDDPAPAGDAPVAARAEAASCPWAPTRRLVRVGLAAKEITQRPASNLVLLVDVSGSMNQPNKLPLVKRSLGLLVRQLGEQDSVALVVYAGASGLVLPSTSCADPRPILAAIERLEAGGSTNGGSGLELAYRVAVEHFVTGGTNRVLLLTDGDWNVGPTSKGALHDLITAKAKSGVFLSVLGFGMGTSGDGTMERLADEGNGHYAYVDGEREAKKVLGREVLGTLVTVAKDVKVQVEWDSERVAAWRLVGYENRRLADADFRNDAKDAGEVGAGHGVTALYEVVLREGAGEKGPLGALRWRWKRPEGEQASEASAPIEDDGRGFAAGSPDLRFGAAVAAFGLLLRDGPAALGEGSYGLVKGWAQGSLGQDPDGLRAELVALVGKAQVLSDGHATRAQEVSSGK